MLELGPGTLGPGLTLGHLKPSDSKINDQILWLYTMFPIQCSLCTMVSNYTETNLKIQNKIHLQAPLYKWEPSRTSRKHLSSSPTISSFSFQKTHRVSPFLLLPSVLLGLPASKWEPEISWNYSSPSLRSVSLRVAMLNLGHPWRFGGKILEGQGFRGEAISARYSAIKPTLLSSHFLQGY